MGDITNVFTDLPGVVTRPLAVTGTRTVTRAWSAQGRTLRGAVWILTSARTPGKQIITGIRVKDEFEYFYSMSILTICSRYSSPCGPNTVCTNSIGSFSCACLPGYELWAAGQGCSDIDECQHPDWRQNKG